MESRALVEQHLTDALARARAADADATAEALRAAGEAAFALESLSERAEVLTDVARLAVGLGVAAPLDELLTASEAAWTEADGVDSVGAWECRVARAVARRVAGDQVGCAALVRGALDAPISPSNADTVVRALHVLAMAQVEQNDRGAVDRALARAAAITEQHDVEPYTVMELARSRGSWVLAHGHIEEALEAFDIARVAALALVPPQPVAVARCLRSITLALLRAERWHDAARTTEHALRMLEALPEPPGVLAELCLDAAALAYRRGQPDDAQRLADRALAVADQVWAPDDPRLIHLLCGVASLHLERGEGAPFVEDLMLRAMGLATVVAPVGGGAAEARVILGRFYRGRGRFDEAVGALSRALSIYQQLDAPADVVAQAMRELALTLAARGELDDAIEGLQAAMAQATSSLAREIQRDLSRLTLER